MKQGQKKGPARKIAPEPSPPKGGEAQGRFSLSATPPHQKKGKHEMPVQHYCQFHRLIWLLCQITRRFALWQMDGGGGEPEGCAPNEILTGPNQWLLVSNEGSYPTRAPLHPGFVLPRFTPNFTQDSALPGLFTADFI
jgi:hypothetical protein